MPSHSQQATISHFFPRVPVKPAVGESTTKRSCSPIDLTFNEDSNSSEEATPRPAKRQRTLSTAEQSSHATKKAKLPTQTSSATNGRAIERWAYRSRSQPHTAEIDTEAFRLDAETKRARRQAFTQKLSETPTRKRSLQPEMDDPQSVSLTDAGHEEDEDDMDLLDPSHDEDFHDGAHPHGETAKGGAGVASLSSASGSKKSKYLGPSGLTYTPLEKQIISLKEQYKDVLLLVEVGYKYRFYGEDARVASKELGIACFLMRNFLSASIPIHRGMVHIKKLVSQGYKVGVIGQAETAALKKVSKNPNKLFARTLSNLYTSASFVDEMQFIGEDEAMSRSASRSLLCVIEEVQGQSDEKAKIGVIAVTTTTGEIIYDEFQDSYMRTELETRMAHLRPVELLLPKCGLSSVTGRVLSHFIDRSPSASSFVGNMKLRTEYFKEQMNYLDALDYVTDIYRSQDVPEASFSNQSVAEVIGLPQLVTIALAHTIQCLKAFSLGNIFTQDNKLIKFTARTHMLLSADTLSNLEIYRNQTDFSEKGSLLEVLDRTKTKFGARLLREWMGRPLIDRLMLQERIEAVEEIKKSTSSSIVKLRQLIQGMPDLAKGLCRVQYGKCTPKELSILLEAFDRVAHVFDPDALNRIEVSSPMLKSIICALPTIRTHVDKLLSDIKLAEARENNMDSLWRNEDKFPDIENFTLGIMAVESDLAEELKRIRKLLHRPSLHWKHVAKDEYLVEVPRNSTKEVPASWIRKSSTKSAVRFQTPEVKKLLEERERMKESKVAECDRAFRKFLEEVVTVYGVLRDCISKLATFDCLNSLAEISAAPGYVKPQFFDDDAPDGLDIEGGRHPMIEKLRMDPFVPNSIALGGAYPRHQIITGPNMGGKSSCVRMTALIIIMAQIGSHVPASSAKLGIHDAVMTRMGAMDELTKGRSTFMVEMSETSNIIRTASPRSLVILDELGRGTSTFDGMAIAFSVLLHLIESVKCKTLFITHYPLLASEMGKLADVSNGHMGFIERKREDGSRSISFLYKLTPGIAHRSFGIECAELAGLPCNVLNSARHRSEQMEERVKSRRIKSLTAKRLQFFLKTSKALSGLSTFGNPCGTPLECVASLRVRTLEKTVCS
ncbi:muts domain V-domain-containing protein [Cantharellus anzutake]|uniref:muts domain V-domain-containing protein n=1 Tax=Cantharellus anzutake TaxID=1750568 RepID=UPI001902DF20|nr:muts domain V-domain-containing protein [Cantharellus anzutake]KAF8331322.1 muts domain V-domain-containing protein [Cantharellus anzutake]